MAKKVYPQKKVVTGPGIELRPNPCWPGTVFPVRVIDGQPKGPVIPDAPPPQQPLAEELKKFAKEVINAVFSRPPEINVKPIDLGVTPPSPVNVAGYDGIHPTALDRFEQVRSWLTFASVIAYSANSASANSWKSVTGGENVVHFPTMTSAPHAPGGFICVYPDYILVAIQGTTTRDQVLRYVSMQQPVRVGMSLGLVADNNAAPGFDSYEPFQDQAELWLGRLANVADQFPGRHVLMTGHSLGGAICQMINYVLALRRATNFNANTWNNVNACVTFGAPRCVVENEDFNLAFPQTASIEAGGDPIPYMPYHGLLRARFLNDAPGPRVRRLRVMGSRGPDIALANCAPAGYEAPPPESLGGVEDIFRKAMAYHSMKNYANRAYQLIETFEELKEQWRTMGQIADKSLIVDTTL